jgi:SAM-dependent methyltransferase
MATGRVDWAWNGHVVTAVFEDNVSVRTLPVPEAERIVECSLVVTWHDQSTTLIDLRHDNIGQFTDKPRAMRAAWFAAQSERGGRVLEVGGRGSNAAFHRSILVGCEYSSMDIVAGPNVDYVGDAHDLLATFAPESFDAVLADQVFEHLHAPWKVVLEINRVLKVGGSVYVCSPSAFPLHAEPWDFFRFSDHSWHSLFNAATGFRVDATELSEPMMITPRVTAAPFVMVNTGRGYMMSSVVATKISEPTVTWEAAPVADSQVWYPESGIAELRNRM